jgi:hypothetical protein
LKNHVKRLRRLASAGSTITSPSTQNYAHYRPWPNLFQLNYVAAEIEDQLKSVLPSGKAVLSEKATRILNELIELVRSSAPDRVKLEQQQVDADNRAQEIQKHISDVESLFYQAVSLIDSSQKETITQAPKIRSIAAEKVTGALDIIASLTLGSQPAPGLKNTVHALELLLQGVIFWIENPDKILSPALSRGYDRLDFIKTSNSISTRKPLSELAKTLEEVLGAFCKRDSLQQLAILISGLLLPLTGWRLARIVLGSPVTPSEKTGEIEKTLRSWADLIQKACGQAPDFTAMATALDPFV